MPNIRLTAKRRARLEAYLSRHLSDMRTRRDQRLLRIQESVRRWEAKSRPSNYPWRGASSMHIPVVAAHGESIAARMKNSLKAQDKRFVWTAYEEDKQIGDLLDPEDGSPITWKWLSDCLEAYTDFELSPAGEIDWDEVEDRFIIDLLQTGTAVLDTRWETITEDVYVTPDSIEPVRATVRDNVRFTVWPFEDLLTPPHYTELDRLPHATLVYRRRPAELRAGVDMFGWSREEVEKLIMLKAGKDGSDISSVEQAIADAEESGDPPSYLTGDIDIAETWMRFDLDGRGREQRILVDHSFDEPFCIFRVIPWPGPFPIDIARYIQRRRRLAGMSLGERLESLDEGISANLNQAINNGTVSTARFWKILKGSPALKVWDHVRPGMKVPVDSMDDIAPEQAGEIYPSIFEIGNVLNAWAEKLSKINDYNMGRESAALGRQSTATSTLALLQETGTYHDSITRETRKAFNSAAQKWFDLIVTHKPYMRIAQILGPKRAQIVIAALNLPLGDLRKRIGVRVAFSSTAATRELARQEEAAKIQLLSEYYKSIVQLAMMRTQAAAQAAMGDPNAAFLVGIADAIAENSDTHMRKLLDVYGDPFTSSALFSWRKVLNDVGAQGGTATAVEARQTKNDNDRIGQILPLLGAALGGAGGAPGQGGGGAPPQRPQPGGGPPDSGGGGGAPGMGGGPEAP